MILFDNLSACGFEDLSLMCFIENSVDAKTVSELLGHSSVQITLNRYMHSNMEMKRRCVANLNLAS